MKRRPRIGKRDQNEAEIIATLEAVGYTVFRIFCDPPGGPDLLATRRGQWHVLQVKTKDGRLTPAQKALAAPLARTPQEALEAVGCQLRF